jgi:F0F1-type ATP synthase assembly protein I
LSIELRKKEKEKKQHSSFYLTTPLKFTLTLIELVIALRGTGMIGNDKGK